MLARMRLGNFGLNTWLRMWHTIDGRLPLLAATFANARGMLGFRRFIAICGSTGPCFIACIVPQTLKCIILQSKLSPRL
jgi:hypothetical protein